MEYHIFYSWQSDIDDSHKIGQRQIIRKAIKAANSAIEKKERIKICLDEATRDTAGAIDIVEEIARKIKQCDVFIADISIINCGCEFRLTPNPNVIFELGLASESVGWNNIILIINEDYGPIKELPFDIGKERRMIQLKLKRQNETEKTGAKEITEDLTNAIKACLDKAPKLRLKEITNALKDSRWSAYNKENLNELKGIVSISHIYSHIFDLDFESYEHGQINHFGHWQARFFIDENTLTTAQLAFRTNDNFGFKTIIFPFDRKYQELYLVGDLVNYGKQLLVRKND